MKKLTRKALCSLLVVLMCLTSVSIGGFSAAAIKVNGDTTYITKADLEDGYIELGSYPQTLVASNLSNEEERTLYVTLLNLTKDAEKTSYGYYSGEHYMYGAGTMKQDVDMSYVDVTYEGVKYRGVYFKDYRPRSTISESSADYSYMDNNGYYSGASYYFFKFEPLKWRVLDKETGLIMCESIIDSQAMSNTVYKKEGPAIPGTGEFTGKPEHYYYYYSDPERTCLSNNYPECSLRSWLNNDFYNTAFSDADKTAIGSTKFLFNKVNYYDNVSLPMKHQVTNADYGFKTNENSQDSARIAQGTDYAKCQGLYVNEDGNSYWRLMNAKWLTDTMNTGAYSSVVTGTGYISDDETYSTDDGIRPIMTLNLHTHDYSYKEVVRIRATHTSSGQKSCQCVCGATKNVRIPKLTEHTYTATVTTPATCTQAGSATYTCACGDTYTGEVPATGHSFSGSKCTVCGYDRANDCSCNCHASGIAHFFFVIVNFFQKLFGSNKTCACGASH